MTAVRIWRSLLFVPANNWKMLNKATSEMQDAVLIDLEDACPPAEKETGRVFARDIVPAFKAKGIGTLVRINSLQNEGVTEEDLRIIVREELDGIMLPKAESGEEICKVAALLSREEKAKGIRSERVIIPLLESPKGIMNAREIASSSNRVVALAFGAADFMREMGAGFTVTRMTPDEYFPILSYPRSVIAVTATALGIPAIDTPFFGLLTDNEGLERESSRVRLLGFKGKLLTHPRHIETVHRVFSPSEEDISASLRMIKAYEEAQAQGKGAASLDGKMIDIAMYRMGLETIAKAEGIEKRARQRKEDA